MATKETRAARRQKALEARNVRRRVKGLRRVHRLRTRYLHRIEAVNDRIKNAVAQTKLLRTAFHEARRSAAQELREGLDGTKNNAEATTVRGLADGVEADSASGGEGRVPPNTPEAGADSSDSGAGNGSASASGEPAESGAA